MCKILLLGVNTRSMVKSALNLGFEVYSSSYYKTFDFEYDVYEKHILDQKADFSCGFFEERYSVEDILSNADSYLDVVDCIVLCSGISSSDFKGKYRKYVSKIVGNCDVSGIEDKFSFYKKVCCDFLVPETFSIVDIDEVYEIVKNNVDDEYILKPRYGSGGYGVYFIKYEKLDEIKMDSFDYENFDKNKWILQKRIKGTNISSSILSTKNTAKNIINSRLLNQNDFNINSYKYGGNILPLNQESLKILNKKENLPKHIPYNEIIKNSEEIIKKLKLIGNNGVDMILTPNNEVYTIEVNPRLQGTYECIEELLNINMLEAHIKACQNEIIEIPKIKNNTYCMKKLIYTNNKIKVENLKYNNIYDIPHPNVKIEKNQPLVTLINKGNDLKKVYNDITTCEKIVNNKIRKID